MRINKEYVSKCMKNNNWFPADLAKAMNVDPSTVSRIFNGTRGTSKEAIADLIAAFPEAKIEDLFF